MKKNIRFKYFTLIGIVLLVGLDQWFKYLATVYLSPIETLPLWKDVFHLTYLENPGAAFGFFAGEKVMLIGLTSVMLVALLVYLLKTKSQTKFAIANLGLVIAGGIGNLIDRAYRGEVIDYLHFKAIDFPIFNFADCCVVVGLILFMICFFMTKEEPKTETKKED